MKDDRAELQLDIPAGFGDIRRISEAALAMLNAAGGVDEITLYNVELAIQEISANIVEHAYEGLSGGRIEVDIRLTRGADRRLIVTLSDDGHPFDSTAVRPVDLDTPHEGGYGMFLARTLMDEVTHELRRGRNVWRLTKRL